MSESQLMAKDRFGRAAEILVLMVGMGILLYLALPFAGDNLVFQQAIFFSLNLLLLAYIWGSLKFRNQNIDAIGLSFGIPARRTFIKVVLWSIPVFIGAVAAFAVGAIIMANIVGMPEPADMSRYDYLQGNPGMLVLSLIGIWFVSSFGEEVVYRGYLMRRFVEIGGGGDKIWWLAAVVSALIFAIAHYEWGPAGMVQSGFMGLALGIAYLKLNRNLWITVLAHAYMDTMLMLQLFLQV